MLRKVIEYLNELSEIANPCSINLCHENEKGIYGYTAERCLEVLKAVPSLKGIFDPANFVQCGVDTLKAWELLKEYIFYMHIKDALYDGSVVPAGKGNGNVETIVKDYIKNGGKEFTVEPHLKVFSGLTALERAGEETKITEFKYPDATTAFDTACNTFKSLLR